MPFVPKSAAKTPMMLAGKIPNRSGTVPVRRLVPIATNTRPAAKSTQAKSGDGAPQRAPVATQSRLALVQHVRHSPSPKARPRCKQLEALQAHHKSQDIALVQTSLLTGFAVEGKYMKGLVPLLKKAFRPPPPPHGVQRCKDATCKGVSPEEHGSIVDKELTLVVNKYKGDVSRIANPDPCTTRLMAHLKEKHWTPLASQVAIYSEAHGFATAIDLVCATGTGEMIVVELKVTHHDHKRSYELGRGVFLAKPLTGIPRSWKNFHLLQLLAMKVCIERTYGVRPGKYVLLRVGSQSIWEYELLPQMVTRDFMTDFGKKILWASKF
jgi:hypothetical protein